MILQCTLCANDFNHTATRGRPPGFCSPECKANAKHDPSRICRACNSTFHKDASTLPFHCSAECRDSHARTCAQCHAPSRDRFCSGKCLADHSPGKQCKACGNTVPPPTTPPFNTMPRYCSQDCRTLAAQAAGHTPARNVWAESTALALAERLTWMRRPLWKLPTKGNMRPYNIPGYAPALDDFQPTAKLLNSIAWWNYIIPVIQAEATHPTLFIAEIGGTGWAPDTPTGCRSLVECWPWVTAEFERKAVLDHWRAAQYARGTTDKAQQTQASKISQWLDEYHSGAWADVSKGTRRMNFFKNPQHGSSPFITKLRNYLESFTPPPHNRIYAPADAEYLASDEYWDLLAKYTARRTRSNASYLVADYADDPTQPVDRLLQQIEEVLDRERKRQHNGH